MDELKSRSLLQHEINFEGFYAVIRQRWWWLTLFIVVGGFLGLLLSVFLQPGYQATASLGIGIDYGRTHPLDRETERQALLHVQELLLSDEVMESALAHTNGEMREQLNLNAPEDLRDQIRLDRFEGRWDLSVFLADPEGAAVLANAWSQASADAIGDALEAAWRARDLQFQIYELGCQLELAQDQESAVLRCQNGRAGDVEELHQKLIETVQRSHGLLPALSFAQLRQALPPDKPVYRARSWLILGGLLIGLAIGMAMIMALPLSQPDQFTRDFDVPGSSQVDPGGYGE